MDLDPGLGLHRRDPLSCATAAPAWHRGAERRTARGAGHPRLDDRHRIAESPGQRGMSYRSHADLGGRSGLGRIVPEPEGELFHAAWEPKALALTLAIGATGAWNIDMSRSARETVPNYEALR